MNEEWFGICAKGPTNPKGLYPLFPRAAYYALKEAHNLDPYGDDMNQDSIYHLFLKYSTNRGSH